MLPAVPNLMLRMKKCSDLARGSRKSFCQAEMMGCTNVSICLTYVLKCRTKIQCLLSSLL